MTDLKISLFYALGRLPVLATSSLDFPVEVIVADRIKGYLAEG